MSGLATVQWAASGFFYLLNDLVRGNDAARIPELIFIICVLVVTLPFFNNLLLIGNRNSRRLQSINVIVWGIAGRPTITMFILQTNRDQFVRFVYLLWGLWLYILLAMGTMIFEILSMRADVKPRVDLSSIREKG
jgi:hypothetical protein